MKLAIGLAVEQGFTTTDEFLDGLKPRCDLGSVVQCLPILELPSQWTEGVGHLLESLWRQQAEWIGWQTSLDAGALKVGMKYAQIGLGGEVAAQRLIGVGQDITLANFVDARLDLAGGEAHFLRRCLRVDLAQGGAFQARCDFHRIRQRRLGWTSLSSFVRARSGCSFCCSRFEQAAGQVVVDKTRLLPDWQRFTAKDRLGIVEQIGVTFAQRQVVLPAHFAVADRGKFPSDRCNVFFDRRLWRPKPPCQKSSDRENGH